jgi:hypothetical protein
MKYVQSRNVLIDGLYFSKRAFRMYIILKIIITPEMIHNKNKCDNKFYKMHGM